MRDDLAAFHDPHDRRLRLIVSVRRDPLVCGLVLLLGLLQLDLVDLDPHLRVRECRVIRKDICWIDVFALGLLGEHPIFGARQGLQRSFQLRVGCGKIVSDANLADNSEWYLLSPVASLISG